MDKSPSKSKLKPRPTSIKIPDDFEPQLKEAQDLTKHSYNDLLIRCARKSLPAVVRELLLEQQKKARDYLKRKK